MWKLDGHIDGRFCIFLSPHSHGTLPLTQQRKWTDSEPRLIGLDGPKQTAKQTAKSAGVVAFRVGLVLAVFVLVGALLVEFLRQPRTTDSVRDRIPVAKSAPDDPTG